MRSAISITKTAATSPTRTATIFCRAEAIEADQYTIAVLRPTPALRACLIAGSAAIAVAGGAFDRPLRAQAPPRLEIALDPHHAWARGRITAAADEAVARYREWLGPPPVDPIAVRVNPWRRAVASDSQTVSLDLAWWPAPRSMDVESQVAFGLARLWWPRLINRDDTRPIADGIAWYLQSRVVERLFDFTYLMPGHSADTFRYFGGAVPWSFSILPRGRWTAGLGRDEFLATRAANRRWPVTGRRVPPEFDGVAGGALAFGTLERQLTWPVLQSALRLLAERSAQADLTRAEVERTFADAAAQDLSWFFRPAFDPAATFDYAVQSLTSDLSSCDGRLCFQTRVTVARLGNGLFTGTSRTAQGGFDAGDAMQLRVTFADRQELSTTWSGREQSRTFEYQSAAPAVAARLDPEQVLVMDVDSLNQTRVADALAVPMGKWLASWVVWLQDAALATVFCSELPYISRGSAPTSDQIRGRLIDCVDCDWRARILVEARGRLGPVAPTLRSKDRIERVCSSRELSIRLLAS